VDARIAVQLAMSVNGNVTLDALYLLERRGYDELAKKRAFE